MNKKNRDSHQVRDRLSSGVLGEKTEEHYIQRGLGSGDHNQNIDYHIAKICDIPSQLFDVLIVGLLFMSSYFFITTVILELLFKYPESLKVVLLLLFFVLIFPVFFAFYAINRNIKLIWGVLFRAFFACTGILFGVL